MPLILMFCLGTQTGVVVNFDFYQIDSWDNENFSVYIDDVQVADDVYSHGGLENPPNATSLDPTNADRVFNAWADQRFRYEFTVPTTATNIKLGFGSTLNSGLTDESWGIDNVLITDRQIVTWDFGSLTLQGWNVLNGDAHFRTGDGDGMTAGNSVGGFAHDGGHDTFLAESPEFTLNGDTLDGVNALVVQFGGGAGDQNGAGVIFNSPADVLAFEGGSSNSNGQKGLAFLNVATGLYEATIFKSGDGGIDTLSFTPADLIALGLDPEHVYRLQFFENDNSSWGWGQLNYVQFAGRIVPEPSTLTMLLVLSAIGLPGYFGRRRRR